MKVPREAWWLAGVLAFAFILVLLIGGGEGQRRERGAPSRTSYSRAPYGLRALYLTLDELGYDPQRLRKPFTDTTLPERGALLLVDPFIAATEREQKALQRWVEAGHTLVLAGGWALPGTRSAFPTRDELFADPPVTRARASQPTYLACGVTHLAVRARERIKAPQSPLERDLDETPEAGHGCGRCVVYSDDMRDALAEAVPLFRDKQGTVVAYAHMGKGRAILLSSPWSLSNEGIGKADNLIFALNAVGSPGAGSVYFDEYHHGYGENLVWALLPLPVKIALAHLLVGLLVVIYAASRRFGAVIPLDRGRRERSEFLGTMTALLRKGRATRLALRTAYDAAVQRLRVELGVPADAGAAELTRAASRVSPEAAEKLGAALRQCRGALEGPEILSEGRAMALVRQLDEAVRSVRQI